MGHWNSDGCQREPETLLSDEQFRKHTLDQRCVFCSMPYSFKSIRKAHSIVSKRPATTKAAFLTK